VITLETKGLEIWSNDLNKLVDTWEANLKSTVAKISDLVVKGVKNNWKGQESFDGSGIAPLKASTLKRKRSLGQPLRVFEATGKMIKTNPVKIKITPLEYDVKMTPDRDNIMKILQLGASPLAGSRRAFGVNEEVLEQADNLLNGIVGR
jgi:hypothetical protein